MGADKSEVVVASVYFKFTDKEYARFHFLGVRQVEFTYRNHGVGRKQSDTIPAVPIVACAAVETEHTCEFGQAVEAVHTIVSLGNLAHGVDIHFLDSDKIGLGGLDFFGDTFERRPFAETEVVGHHGKFALMVGGEYRESQQ